jgi:uncharacterized protein YecA (UPF0149 family)
MKAKRKVLIHRSKNRKPLMFKKEPSRNAKCKCGSDKKYKSCCLPKLEAGEQKLIVKANKP